MNQNSVMPFGKLPVGALFKPMKSETIRSVVLRKEKIVDNRGSFVKICDAYSMNVATHADAIFLKSMPCSVLPKPANFDKDIQFTRLSYCQRRPRGSATSANSSL